MDNKIRGKKIQVYTTIIEYVPHCNMLKFNNYAYIKLFSISTAVVAFIDESTVVAAKRLN